VNGCAREAEVVNAVLTGAWPNHGDEALMAHALECDVCREVAAIAALMQHDADRARHEVHLPAAGQVWWRSAVRARLESAHAATRPITWMHGITGAVALGLALAVLTVAWPMVAPAADRVWLFALGFFPSAEAASVVADSLRASLIIGLVAVAFLVLAPLALYFVLSDD
jgi:hypothetical protein